MYAEASKAAVRISNPELASQVNTLLTVNAYEQEDLPGTAALAAIATVSVLFFQESAENSRAETHTLQAMGAAAASQVCSKPLLLFT
jgi:hypothetical protein